MKMIRKSAIGIFGIVLLIAALCCVALAADLFGDAKPAAVDAAHYSDFMSEEVLDLQDLAQWAEIQRRMFNRITPPDVSLFQPMSPPVVPFEAANYSDDFLEKLLGVDLNSVAVYPLSLALDPKTRATLIYNADGKLIAAVSKNNAFPAVSEGEDPSRVMLRLDLLPAEDVEPYLYTESRVAESLAIMDEEAFSGGGGMGMMMSPGTTNFGIVDFQSQTNGTMRLTVTNSAGTAEVFSYTVWHTADVVVVTYTNEQSNVVTDTNTLWYPVSPPYNGMGSAWTNRTTNLACTNGVGIGEDANITSNARVRFYAVTLRTDSDGDGLTDGAEYFVHHTNPGTNDTDGDGIWDGWEVLYGLNTSSNDALLDPDGDGRTNIEEFNHTNSSYSTACIFGDSNPTNKDTDGDGVTDGPLGGGGAYTNGPDAFPRDPCAVADTDCDGQPDALTCTSPLTEDADDDNDGLPDAIETIGFDRIIPITVAPFKIVSVQARPTNVFLSSYSSMAVVGTNLFPSKNWESDTRNMTLISNHVWELVHSIKWQANAEFKFAANGSWSSNNWGDSSQSNTNAPINDVANRDVPSNIRLGGSLNGTYRFRFNETSLVYSIEKLSITNMGTEQFDVSSSGRGLPYAAGSNASNGYGNVNGGLFFNHDGTNLYLGLAGVDIGDKNVLMVFLDTDGPNGGVTNLAGFSGDPEAFGTANNLSFSATNFTPNVGILVGCKSFWGRNMPWAYVGDNKVGQGVYRLSSTGVYHFAGFSTNGGGRFSQWGDRIAAHSPANAGIEIALALTNLGLDVSVTNTFKAAAIFAGGTGGTPNRFFSSEAYGNSASSPAGFATNPVTLIGAPVYLSAQAASSTGGMATCTSSDVILQGFYWAVPRPPYRPHATLSVAGSFNSWNPATNNMGPVADYTWEYIHTFTNATNVAFKFAANGAWSEQWGATNGAPAQSLPITNGVAETNSGINANITLSGAITGTVRFRINTDTKRYTAEYVTNGTPTVLLTGYTNVYWHEHLRRLAVSNSLTKFSMIWMPQPVKCGAGPWSSGYDPYDHYDLGATNVAFTSKTTKRTRFGSDTELIGCTAALAQTGIVSMVDLVLNHMAGGYANRYNYQYYHGTFEKPDSAGNNSSNYFNTAGSFEPFQVDMGYGENSGDINHRHPYLRQGLKTWGAWISSKVGYQAYRWDVAYHIDPWFISEFMNYGPMRGKFAVMEGWSLESGQTAKEMETYLALTDYRAAMFDMPLREKLAFMCNDPANFDMETLNSGSFSSIRPGQAVTFVESHDTIRAYGDSDQAKKGIEKSKELAYAYVLMSEGLPCVFYHDYYEAPYVDNNPSSTGWQGMPLKDKIDPLIAARTNYAAGGTEYLSTSNKFYLYIARRTGDGQKPGCILAINNHTNTPMFNTLTVGSFYTNGTVLVDYLDNSHSATVTAGQVTLGASNRSYRIYVKQ